MIQRDKLYSVADLLERGWTRTAIELFLPSVPDDTRPNPRFSKAGAPMKFWLIARVNRAEKTKRFLEWKAGAESRKNRSARGVSTRVNNISEGMRNATLTIERGLSKNQIYDLAIRTHGGNYAGNPGEFVWSNRTARNCIRHNLTNYEELWALTNRGSTGRLAYEELRSRVDKLIGEAYPEYAESKEDESSNQK